MPKGSWAKTGADALQDELCVADIFAWSLADLKAAVRACLVPAPCLSRHTGNSASPCVFPVCFSLRVKGCEHWEPHCSWKASQAVTGAKKGKAGDYKHPPGVVHDGILCPRAPARGTVVHTGRCSRPGSGSGGWRRQQHVLLLLCFTGETPHPAPGLTVGLGRSFSG